MAKQCSHCGAQTSMLDKFCPNCGSDLMNQSGAADYSAPYADYEPVETEAVDIIIEGKRSYGSPAADAREVRERLVGDKTEYYLPRFEQMETLNSFTGWNWAAFLFGACWMIYRKMYAFAIALLVVTNVLSLMGASLLSLIVNIGVGVCGNYLYMKDINKRTETAMNLQPEQREAYIQKNSGSSWVGVGVLLLVSFLLGIILI